MSGRTITLKILLVSGSQTLGYTIQRYENVPLLVDDKDNVFAFLTEAIVSYSVPFNLCHTNKHESPSAKLATSQVSNIFPLKQLVELPTIFADQLEQSKANTLITTKEEKSNNNFLIYNKILLLPKTKF